MVGWVLVVVFYPWEWTSVVMVEPVHFVEVLKPLT